MFQELRLAWLIDLVSGLRLNISVNLAFNNLFNNRLSLRGIYTFDEK